MLSSHQLSKLWQNHSASLLLLARSRCREPDDCVQQAFIRLAAQDPAPESPLAWLVTVVRNEASSYVRADSRRRQREQIAAEQRPWFTDSDGPGDIPAADEVQEALQHLDPETRDIIIAHLWTQLTFRQIAEVFEMSRATVHRRYESGLRQLRDLLHVTSAAHRSTDNERK